MRKLVWLALLVSSVAKAADVSVPALTVINNVPVAGTITVTIDNSSADVEAADITITYNSAIFTVTGNVTPGGDFAGCLFVTNFSTPGTVTVAIACSPVAVPAPTTFFTIPVQSASVGVSNVNFTECAINEGSETCNTTNGQLQVLGPTPTSSSTATITPTATNTRTATATNTRTNTPLFTPTFTVTWTPINTYTPTLSGTCIPTDATPSATPTNTNTPSATPTNTASSAAPDWSNSFVAVWNLEGTTSQVSNSGTSCTTDCTLNSDFGTDPTKDTTNKVIGTASASFNGTTDVWQCDMAGTTGKCNELNIGTNASWGCFARATQDSASALCLSGGGVNLNDKDNYRVGRNAANDRVASSVTSGGTLVGCPGTTNGWPADSAWRHVGGTFNDSTNLIQNWNEGSTDNTACACNSMDSASSAFFNLGVGASTGLQWTGNLDECFVYSGVLSATAWCRIASCGVDGSLCTCAGSTYTNDGRHTTASLSCTLPACNSTTP